MSTPYTIERYQNEADWLKARLRSIGSSESRAVLRLDKYCGPLGLYVKKREGRTGEEGDSLMGEFAEAGHLHEHTVRRMFRTRTGLRVGRTGKYTVYRSNERPHLTATLDGWIEAEQAPVELKCAWYESAKEWETRVPIGYQCQLQHQLYVTGATHGYFAVLLNGYRFKYFKMERHRFIERIVRECDAFWDRLQRKDPPVADRKSLHALYEMHPRDNGQAVYLSRHAIAAAERLRSAEQMRLDAEAAIQDAKAVIQQEIGDARYGVLPSGEGFDWRTNRKGVRSFHPVNKVHAAEVA